MGQPLTLTPEDQITPCPVAVKIMLASTADRFARRSLASAERAQQCLAGDDQAGANEALGKSRGQLECANYLLAIINHL